MIQVSSYALARSRKIADVVWFRLNPLLMAASNWMRLSEVVHPRRNPVWCLGRNVCLSKYHFILLLIIFSISFARQEVREIGRYESAFYGAFPGFRIGVTVAFFHEFGM